MSRGSFYPMAERIWLTGYITPWGLRVEYDDQRNGFWVEHDPEYKNTVTDPRDALKAIRQHSQKGEDTNDK